MTRALIASLVLLVGFAAQAADEWTQMSANDLIVAKEAVYAAWRSHTFACSGTVTSDGETTAIPDINSNAIIANISDETAVGFTKADGTQPAVYFSTAATQDGMSFDTTIYVAGDAGLANVTEVTAHQVVKSGELEQVIDVTCK